MSYLNPPSTTEIYDQLRRLNLDSNKIDKTELVLLTKAILREKGQKKQISKSKFDAIFNQKDRAGFIENNDLDQFFE